MRKRSVPVLLPTFLVLGVLGAWAGTSMGQVPPVPTVSLPTVTVPPAPVPPAPPPPPVPTVTTPQVELPTPPKPPATPPAPIPLPVPVPDTPVAPLPNQATPGAPSSAGPAGPAQRHFGASSRIATISRVRTSRAWVSSGGPASNRGLWITFWLSRPGTVVFMVDEVAPDCRYAGRFLVRGRAGHNSVRFRGRVAGRTLDPGTYRLSAYPRRDPTRRIAGVTVVILERAPAPTEVAAARARNTCPGGVPPSLRAATAGLDGTGPTSGVAGVQATAASRPFVDESPGPLGAAVGTIQSAAEAVPPVLFALAALAVLLLALAAMPQPVRASRAGAALVHHRGTLALAGVGVLVAALLSFALLQ